MAQPIFRIFVVVSCLFGNYSEQRAAAGRSQTRLAKPVHEHVVTTPCKREYRTAVQRVMDDQVSFMLGRVTRGVGRHDICYAINGKKR